MCSKNNTMKEIKNTLKEARDAINQKDFDSALKLSKSILKKDKNNYMGLVMLGVALKDSEQAPLAFKMAISLNGTKVLAWQGLEKYYDKIESVDSWKELVNIYEHLLSLEDDLNKYKAICIKFYHVALKLVDIVKFGNILYNHYLKTTVEKQAIVYSTLTKLLEDSELDNSEETLSLIQNVFDKYNSENENIEFVLKYFKYLKLSRGFNHMFHRGNVFLKKTDVSDLKYLICKTYFEIVVLQDSQEINHSEVLPFIEEFVNSNVNANSLHFIKAGLFYQKMEYFNAYYIGSYLLTNNTESEILCIFVAKCCLQLQRWLEAENISEKLIFHTDAKISTSAVKILLIATANQSDTEKCNKAIELTAKLDSQYLGVSEFSALFYAYLFTAQFVKAQECLKHLEKSEYYFPFSGLLLKKTNKYEEAFQILNDNKEAHPLCWFELALLHWDKEDFEKSLVPLLQAARFDKYNFSIFLYLGKYYSVYDVNVEKAKKCFQKAYTLNPECSQAGKSLSSAYRYLQNWKENYELLKDTLNSKSSQNSWAWLALGQHHLALEQWTEAIVNIRTFLRLNPTDPEAWESLADGYYSRGSFLSALKCYRRASDLDRSRKYSLVQIGTVQRMLGQFNNALLTYKSIDDDEYLPALKGMAEVKLCIAVEKFSQNLFGCSQENAQEAINLITMAILKENSFACFWKVLSNAVSFIARLPSKYRRLYINPKFNIENESEKLAVISEANVFLLAIRCLCKAINLSSTFYSYLYHDLATVYLDYYKYYGNKNDAQRAYAAIRKCLSAEKNVWQYWNTLGVICMSKGVMKFAIAQHAFLKALALDGTNSVIWSNIGVFYLYLKKTILANRSFQKAQQFDPFHLQSWIGQALIAESVGHEDAMDLFRHSTQLGFHKESSLGYAEWVCNTLINSKDQNDIKFEYAIKNMHAIPVACDLMTWLNEYENENACCLNIYGVLLEEMGLLNRALASFQRALTFVDDKYRDIVLLNCGRTSFRLGKYDAAIEMFKSVSEASLHCACGLALSLYKCENYEEACAMYNTALQWLTNDDNEKSELLAAMASMTYKFKGVEDCKTLLFQSVQLNKDNPSVSGLLAIFSIGLLHSEQALANLVIEELHKLSNTKEYVNYVGFFESYLLLKNNNPFEAIKKIVAYIHMYPDSIYLWQHLSKYCLTESNSNALLASRSAQKVFLLEKSKENIIQNYRVASIAELFLNNLKSSKKFVQKAIHMCPDNAENWALLLSILLHQEGLTDMLWIKNLLSYIKKYLNPSKSIRNWLVFFERHFIINSQTMLD